MVNFRTFKIKFKNWAYKKVSEWYVKLTNERNYNLTQFTNGYEYMVNPLFDGCNMCVRNPIEIVYFALKTVYKHYETLSIQSIVVDYNDSQKKLKFI